jgi:hypothetical protein
MGECHVSEFETLKDIVAAGRKREGTALDIVRRPAPYSYHKLCTNVWKAGNLLGHYGVHTMGEVAVAIGPKSDGEGESELSSREWGRLDAGEPLLGVLGGTILGAVVDLTPTEPVDAPALVAPAHWDIEVTPGCRHLAYGGPPSDPEIVHFERSVWSENPIEPPEQVDPHDEALLFEDESWTHSELLAVVSTLVAEHDIGPGTQVVLDATLTEPGAFVAGILAPMAAGATVVVPEKDTGDAVPDDTENVLVVTTETADETTLSAIEVTRSMRDTGRA